MNRTRATERRWLAAGFATVVLAVAVLGWSSMLRNGNKDETQRGNQARGCGRTRLGYVAASPRGAAIRASCGESRNPRVSDTFGATSLTLGLAGREHALVLRRFLRAGGFTEVTPTVASVWWDEFNLHVEFENTERNPRYRGNPGLAKPNHYPGTGRFDLASWPDAVYVHYRANWNADQKSNSLRSTPAVRSRGRAIEWKYRDSKAVGQRTSSCLGRSLVAGPRRTRSV